MSEHSPHICLRTGAYLRPWFEHRLAEAVADAHTARLPLTLLWVDVDDTQEANDTRGRPAVDEALEVLVEDFCAVLDGRGPVGHVGGDAYAAFLFAVTPDAGARLAEALRRRFAERTRPGDGSPWRLTVSVGVAAMRPGEPYGNLLEVAEAVCLQAKQGGRDRVVVR